MSSPRFWTVGGEGGSPPYPPSAHVWIYTFCRHMQKVGPKIEQWLDAPTLLFWTGKAHLFIRVLCGRVVVSNLYKSLKRRIVLLLLHPFPNKAMKTPMITMALVSAVVILVVAASAEAAYTAELLWYAINTTCRVVPVPYPNSHLLSNLL